TSVGSTALAVSAPNDQINLSNRIGNLVGGSARFLTHLYAFYGDVTLGYKELLFVHGSVRNDNTSILNQGNRSFVYPGVDASLVFSNAIPALRDASFLDYGKIRGGYTVSGAGFPFGSIPSFTANGNIVSRNPIIPENTRSAEAGIELSFLKHRLTAGATYYNQHSINQTIQTTIPYSTGYQSLTLNAGEVQNQGVEADLSIT
nr:hypothetical protein [Tanacetum cinerariifolium]